MLTKLSPTLKNTSHVQFKVYNRSFYTNYLDKNRVNYVYSTKGISKQFTFSFGTGNILPSRNFSKTKKQSSNNDHKSTNEENLALFEKEPKKQISSMPHDDIYILDANLIIGYVENSIPLWTKWVDDHVAAKKQLFVLPRSAAEVNGGLPDKGPFVILNSSDKKPDNILDHVYEEICTELDIKGKVRSKLKTDLKVVAEVGYAAASSEMISDEDLLADKVVFASNNFKCIKRVLNTKEKREKVEKALDKHGLEHLIKVRGVLSDGTYEDFC